MHAGAQSEFKSGSSGGMECASVVAVYGFN